MPKLVDAETRRREIAEAVFRVVRRDGLPQTPLRSVADEAGLAIGSIRHYFAHHDELIVFAMRTLVERLFVRLLAHSELFTEPAGAKNRETRLQLTERLLGELLPLDDQRLAETEAWHSFSAAAHLNPGLADEAAKVHANTRALVRRVLTEAARGGNLIKKFDLDLETERLGVLLEGLSLSATHHPGRTTPDLMRRVLRRHLESLQR